MPTIKVSKKELKKHTKGDLDEILSVFKAEIEREEGDELYVEIKDSNRPDLFSTSGLIRAINVYMKSKTTNYPLKGFGVKIIKKKVESRPHIAACVVKNVKLNAQRIKEIMHLQEVLDKTIGRNRERTSIGLYDFNKIKPPVIYKTTKSHENAFIPLNSEKKMTPAEILEYHEKGKEYGYIVKNKVLPIFVDSKNNVLSFPPIINSNDIGKITEKTKNILVEVTGTDEKSVEQVLRIVCLALADMGGQVYYGELGTKKFPELQRKELSFSLVKLGEVAGEDFGNIKELLKKMDYVLVKQEGKEIIVKAPAYRTDIISEIDIIEDIIIARGYDKIKPEPPSISTMGSYNRDYEKVRENMLGAGFQEIQTFILCNPEFSRKIGIVGLTRLENPMNENYSALRKSLIPGILDFLSKNTHIEYPQKIFEIGDVIIKTQNKKHMCGAISHSSTDFTEGKRVLEAIFKNIKFKEKDKSPFIKGRCAEININSKKGIVGEVHPEYLLSIGIYNPVVIFEVEL